MHENNQMEKFNTNHLVTQSGTAGTSSLPKQGPAMDCEWGVDYLSFSFPVDESQSSLSSSLWTWEGSGKHRDSDKEYTVYKAKLTLGNAVVQVTYKPEYAKAYVDFNPSRAIKPKSAFLSPPAALKAIVSALLDQLQDALCPAFDVVDAWTGAFTRLEQWDELISIHRLDVARNFFIDDVPTVKAHLMKAQPKYGKTNHVYWDRKGGWTLQNSTKKVGHDRIYDKYAELQGISPDDGIGVQAGTFRFEAQLHKDRLDKFGLKALYQVTDENVWNALLTRWEACLWAIQVPERGTLLKAVADLPAAKKEGLLGYLYLAAEGQTSSLTKEHVRDRNRLAKSLGLQPGMSLSDLGVPTRQLDLYSGTLIPIDCAREDVDEAA